VLLTQYDEGGRRASVYTSSMQHRATSATDSAFEQTLWRGAARLDDLGRYRGSVPVQTRKPQQMVAADVEVLRAALPFRFNLGLGCSYGFVTGRAALTRARTTKCILQGG
jgi:hypothetical protein